MDVYGRSDRQAQWALIVYLRELHLDWAEGEDENEILASGLPCCTWVNPGSDTDPRVPKKLVTPGPSVDGNGVE